MGLLVCSLRQPGLESDPHVIRPRGNPWQLRPQTEARAQDLPRDCVTRVEQWCVEAESAEEACELLVAGAGYRCEIGECINIEVETIED
jgi:hypothetical protein